MLLFQAQQELVIFDIIDISILYLEIVQKFHTGTAHYIFFYKDAVMTAGRVEDGQFRRLIGVRSAITYIRYKKKAYRED